MNSFLNRMIRNNQSFRLGVAKESGIHSVNVIRQGEANVTSVPNMKASSSVNEGDSLIISCFGQKNFILGISPYVSTLEAEEVE